MRDFQCFEQSSLKRNYDFTEVPMATYYKQPGVHTKNFQPISQQRIALIQFVCNRSTTNHFQRTETEKSSEVAMLSS